MLLLKVKEGSEEAKAFIEYVKSIPFVEVVEKEKYPNAETRKAIADAVAGKSLVRAKNAKDALNKALS